MPRLPFAAPTEGGHRAAHSGVKAVVRQNESVRIPIEVPSDWPTHEHEQEQEIEAAIDQLESLARERAGDALIGTCIEHVRSGSDAEVLDITVLVIRTRNMSRRDRHRLSEELLDHLAELPSQAARQHVTVVIR